MRTRITTIILLASAICSSSRAQHASPAQRAQELFEEAVHWRKQGRLDRACPLFDRSQALDPGRGTLLNIARCRAAQNRLLEARDAYEQLVADASGAGDEERHALAVAELDEVVRQLPTLVFSSSEPEPLRVVVDRRTLGTTPLSPLQIDPGRHVVVAAADGFRTWQRVITVEPGQNMTIEIPALKPVRPEPVAQSALASSPEPWWKQRRTWIWFGGAASGVALSASGYFAFRARTDWKASDDECVAGRDICSVEGRRLIDSASTSASLATILGSAGVFIAATTLALYASEPAASGKSAGQWRWHPAFGRSSVGASLAFDFD